MAGLSLDIGKAKLGWLLDGDESTPPLQAMLEDSGTELLLTLSWSETGGTAFTHRWFAGRSIRWSDDPDYTLYHYELPPILWFETDQGIAALVNARPASSTTNLRIGTGTAHVDFAVLNTGGADYSHINGLRSEVVGLLEWFGQRTAHEDWTVDDQNRVESHTVTMNAQPSLRLARALNLHLQPSFSVTHDSSGDRVLHETATIETRLEKARPWFDHLVAHNTVRDIVSIASWHSCGYRQHWALRNDDPNRVLSGQEVGERWAEVRTHITAAGSSTDPPKRFLYRYGDVGTTGFRRWRRIRSHFARGVNPLLATLDRRNGGLEANLALSCIGLDGLGYQLALDAGLSKSAADRETHRQRFQRVGSRVGGLAPFDLDEWSQRAADASNGIKHANRDMPDVLTMANTLRENSLVFRLWVGTGIGVSKAVLERNVAADTQARQYTTE